MIEILNEKEIEKYKEIIDECFQDSNNIDEYKKYKAHGNYIIFVKKINDKIVGSITAYKIDLFTFSFQPALELFNVCVLKEYRKQNIAKEIMEYIKEYAKNNGYKSIYLNCLETAHNAHKLYESVGMKRNSSIKFSMDI